jgi:hypothetical protein
MGHSKSKILVSVYLPAEMHEALRTASFRTRVPMSVLLEGLVRRHLPALVVEIETKDPPAGR